MTAGSSVTFLLSKDPLVEHTGDMQLARLMMQFAADEFDVSAICLSGETGTAAVDVAGRAVPLTRVRKSEIRPRELLAGALRHRRSLVHVRFDTDVLRDAVDAADADVFVAEHNYMAESFLRSATYGNRRLVVNTNVSESLVWRATRGLLGRIEEPRLLRDELRIARAADAVGTYDADEAEFYRANGIRDARWLDITMEPADPVPVSETSQRLVLMGTRDWPPNQEAFLYALKLWPRIAEGLPDAELCIIGAKKPGAVDPEYPPGVRDLGYVDDLVGFLRSCRALVAPIKTGGGVRVKLLDAIRMGLPVVGTTAAIGSLGPMFDLPAFDDDDEFVAQCRRFLIDRDAATACGSALHDVNRRRWEQRLPHRAVADLLRGAAPAAPG